MSETVKIGFLCHECENQRVFSITYIKEGYGIVVDCDECGTEQEIGEHAHECENPMQVER